MQRERTGSTPSYPIDSPRPPSNLDRIAHDLRTPLTGLTAHLDFLEAGKDGPLTPEQRSRLGRMRAILGRVSSLVQRVTDLALIESGRLPVNARSLDPAELILLAVADAERTLGARLNDIRLHLPDTPPAVRAEPARLRQALVTILLDALGRAGGRGLEVAMDSRGEKEGMVDITVRRVPSGIPMEAFDSNRDDLPGTMSSGAQDAAGGLGLAVAAALARHLGGDLAIEDGREGTLAVLTLPSARIHHK